MRPQDPLNRLDPADRRDLSRQLLLADPRDLPLRLLPWHQSVRLHPSLRLDLVDPQDLPDQQPLPDPSALPAPLALPDPAFLRPPPCRSPLPRPGNQHSPQPLSREYPE